MSINNTVIHFRNIADFPVVCFDNGEFEGYNTSIGKIERVGNHVTGTFAAALLRWLVRDADGSGDARRQAIAESVTDPSIAQILQHLCDTVRPHLEYIVAYFNALAQSPQLTRATWGEHLPLLGLFRDPAFLQTPSASARALTENHTLSQVSYWQRETNERIRNASLGKRAQALLLGVLADSSRLPQAKRELNLGDIRPLVTRSRRSAEQIAQTQIRADLQLVHFNWQAEESEGGTIDDLILGIFEYFRSRAQPSLVVPPPAEGSRSEELQKAIGYLRPKTITAIQKALAQQTPLLATNIFLGILRCLLAWKEEQEAKTGQGTTTLRGIGLFPQARIEKLSVLGVQLLPNPTKEKWATLVSKVDRQIREQWGELLRDTVLDLLMEHDQPTGIAAHTNAQAHGVSPATSKIKRSPRAASAMRTGGSTSQANREREEAEEVETMPGEDPLLEQMHDLENGEAKTMDVPVQIVGSSVTGGRAQGPALYSFQLEYDPVESLFLQRLVSTPPQLPSEQNPPLDAASRQRSPGERTAQASSIGIKSHTPGWTAGMAWVCESETHVGSDIRSVGLAMMHGEVRLKATVPHRHHHHTSSVDELWEMFSEITRPMREKGEGLGYFSTLLLPSLPPFLTAYIRLLLAARSTEQDTFESTYGPWIAHLFTVDLAQIEQMPLTQIVTPFHPLQLRWRQTYETLLVEHIEQCCIQPATLTAEFLEELENLSPTSVPSVLTARRTRLSPARENQDSTRGSDLSYPGTESRTGLLSGYKATLPRLQKLPTHLARKVEQFFRVYPSAIDRAQVSVISPGDFAVEHSLSQIFEVMQRKYGNAGFFTRLFVPDETDSVATGQSSRHRRYDEDQGELRVRTRHHLFPRTEFVTLRQDLLKTPAGQRFLFGSSAGPTQHLFLVLDQLGVVIESCEIPPEARAVLDAYTTAHEGTSPSSALDATPALSVLLHQGQETFDEQTQVWTRGLVDMRDAFSLLYYVIAARSQGRSNSLYRYACHLARFRPGEFGSDTLIKTLHEHGIWVAIVDRAITREFFRASSPRSDTSLVLIDFHKGIGPQREYNLTISSTWTQRVQENVEMALDQIARATNLQSPLHTYPKLATAILRQLQDISGGLALQLAATDANTKGLLGLLVTSFELARKEPQSEQRTGESPTRQRYTTVIPLDDHNDWFEREEVRTDLLIVHFEPDEGTQVVHLHFTCIECKFDERVQRASKGISQLEETARRLQKRFAQSAPEYPFRLRDLAEAVRSLAPLYRGHLPEFLLDLLWTNNPQVNLHLAEGEIKLILALYQIDDHLSEVQAMCRQHGYQLLSNEPVPFQHLAGLGGEHLCVYRSGSGVGQMFDRFVRWMADDL